MSPAVNRSNFHPRQIHSSTRGCNCQWQRVICGHSYQISGLSVVQRCPIIPDHDERTLGLARTKALSSSRSDGRTRGRVDGRMYGRSNRRAARRTHELLNDWLVKRTNGTVKRWGQTVGLCRTDDRTEGWLGARTVERSDVRSDCQLVGRTNG